LKYAFGFRENGRDGMIISSFPKQLRNLTIIPSKLQQKNK